MGVCRRSSARSVLAVREQPRTDEDAQMGIPRRRSMPSDRRRPRERSALHPPKTGATPRRWWRLRYPSVWSRFPRASARLQANHVPENERSARVLERLGFEREGYARDYLFIGGRWRDHVLTALLHPDHPGPG